MLVFQKPGQKSDSGNLSIVGFLAIIDPLSYSLIVAYIKGLEVLGLLAVNHTIKTNRTLSDRHEMIPPLKPLASSVSADTHLFILLR